MIHSFLWRLGSVLSLLAITASAGLLIVDASTWVSSGRSTAAISAAPLLLVGASFLLVQPVIRPPSTELLKNLLLAATFLLWGTVQLMPQNEVSRRLGNLVVALYVLDLAWVVLTLGNSNRKR